jgi:hypothetical protein
MRAQKQPNLGARNVFPELTDRKTRAAIYSATMASTA